MQNLASNSSTSALIRKFGAGLLIVGLGLSLSGCVVYPGRPGGWCYWHPYRCR